MAPDLTTTLRGVEFALHPSGVAQWLLVEMGAMASEGVDTEDPEGAALIMEVVHSCLRDESEFRRFRQLAVRERVGVDEIVETFLSSAIEVSEARPTQPSSGSPAGRYGTSESYEGASFSPDTVQRVVDRMESKGRGDLALIVTDSAAHVALRRSA